MAELRKKNPFKDALDADKARNDALGSNAARINRKNKGDRLPVKPDPEQEEILRELRTKGRSSRTSDRYA